MRKFTVLISLIDVLKLNRIFTDVCCKKIVKHGLVIQSCKNAPTLNRYTPSIKNYKVKSRT